MSDDFYEDDEPVEKIDAILAGDGEDVVTIRSRDLNQRAASVVHRATERALVRETEVQIVDTTGWFAPEDARQSSEQIKSTNPTITDDSLAHAGTRS